MYCALLLLASLSFAHAGGAARIDVPGDFPSVQEAIDAAQPGAKIVVHGGTFGPILIDKPLSLIGDPAPLFVNGNVGTGLTAAPPIELAGPGSGKLILTNVSVGGTVDGFLFAFAGAGIQGGGFKELHVYHSDVRAPAWLFLTGVADGVPAIDTSVPSILVSSSTVHGGRSGNDGACLGGGPPGAPGILAPDSTVIVLDSTVTGGGSDSICGPGFCPTSGGNGGAGILAGTLYHAGSTILGGVGAEYFDSIDTDPCGQAAAGAPWVVQELHALPDDLHATGELALGGAWTLTWNKHEPFVMLIVTEERRLRPRSLFGNLLFVDRGRPLVLRVYPGGTGAHTLAPPDHPFFIGRRLTAQLFGPRTGLTRPVTDTIRPGLP